MTAQTWDSQGGRMLIDSLADGVYVTDLERKIVLWNKSAERITGYRASDIVGTTCYDDVLVHEGMDGHRLCGEETCPLHRAIVSGTPSTLPHMVFAKWANGTRIPMEVSVAPLRDEEGNIVGGVESFRDLSPLLVDLQRARAIQDLAMKRSLPDEPRLEFASRNLPQEYVSGDFCRVEKLGDDLVAIMMADVMGHGIAAALHTMQIRSLWEEARGLVVSPDAFLSHMDEKLAALTPEEDFFATAFLCILDVKKKTLRYVTAGHPPPALIRGGCALPLEGCGAALGLLGDSTYEIRKEEILAGDILLAFTDGAVEACSPEGEELGTERLLDMFRLQADAPLEEAMQNLQDEIVRFSGRIQLADDLSLLAVRVK